jgi:hypothetical protein
MSDPNPNPVNMFNSHKITIMTTTTFKIVLIFWSMGIYVLTSHNTTPTTMSVIKIENIGMTFPPG